MLARLLTQTMEIFHPTQTADGYDDLVDQWPATPTATTKCRLQLDAGTESTEGRDVAIGRWRTYVLPVSVVERDRVRVDGRMFNVISVYPVQRPGTGTHHLLLMLETYNGTVPSG